MNKQMKTFFDDFNMQAEVSNILHKKYGTAAI